MRFYTIGKIKDGVMPANAASSSGYVICQRRVFCFLPLRSTPSSASRKRLRVGALCIHGKYRFHGILGSTLAGLNIQNNVIA